MYYSDYLGYKGYYLYHLTIIYLLSVGTKVNLDSPQKLTFPAGGNRHFSKFLLAGPPTSQGKVHGDDVGAKGHPWHFNSLSTYVNNN